MQHRYTLTPPQKAAAVLIAMGKPRAKQLLKYFKSDELRRMIDAGHTLNALPQTDVDLLVSEFEEAFVEGSGLIDTADAIEAILGDALPDEADPAMVEPPPPAPGTAPVSPWERIADVEADTLALRLADEPPHLVAAMLAQLAPTKAAAVLQAMPSDIQSPIVTKMMTARDVPAERLAHVGRALVRDLKLDQDTGDSNAAPIRVAEIFNAMDKQASEALMQQVREGIDPKKLAALESRLFRFDDMVLLGDSARTLVVDGLPSDLLVTALRGADADLKEAILSSISQRARKMIESELTAGGQETQTQIADARKSIAQLAMKLAAEGRLTLPKRG